MKSGHHKMNNVHIGQLRRVLGHVVDTFTCAKLSGYYMGFFTI